ncbi:MAG: hypothetical protein EBS49_09180, partial [Verrucomicrobia bacterium]|nr:hypothetical protein [Verrucomicrobiota bacterium]
AGTVTLSGANTHSGMNTLSGGVLLLGNDSALGSNKLLIDFNDATAKTLAASGSATRTIANNLEIYNDLTLGQASVNTGSLILNGAVALGNEANLTRQITVADGTSHTFGGVISGLRGIVKKGTGTLTLGGNNTFSGANYLVEGTTLLTSATGAGTGIQYLGETSGSGSATLAVGGSGLTVGNAITVRTGSSGTKKIDAVNATGTTTLSGNLTLDAGATLAATNGGGLNLGGSTLTFGNTMILAVTNSSDVSIGNQLVTSGDALIAKRGTGTLILTNGSNYGDMRYDLYEGKLQVGAIGNLGQASTYKGNKLYFNGGTLKITDNLDLAANNGISLGAGGGTIEVDSGKVLTVREYISDGSATGVSFFKTGAGTLFLNKSGS